MTDRPPAPIAAERRLIYETDAGPTAFTATVSLPFPDDGAWACEVRVPPIDYRQLIFGIDGVQALKLGILMLESLLEHPPAARRMSWPDGTPYEEG